MSDSELHPLAAQLMRAFSSHDYFMSRRLTNELAKHCPTTCLRWAYDLVEPEVAKISSHETVRLALLEIRSTVDNPFDQSMSRLDHLANEAWISNTFDKRYPSAHRAVARQCWAAAMLISLVTGDSYESEAVGVVESVKQHGILREMGNQCGTSIDMMFTATEEGRLMVAASFTREMKRLR